MQDTCAMLSKAYVGEAVKKLSIFSGINSSKRVKRNEDNALHLLHFEFIPQYQTVNQAHYVEILKQLHETVYTERPEFWPNN
jgi:hypothetical protein